MSSARDDGERILHMVNRLVPTAQMPGLPESRIAKISKHDNLSWIMYADGSELLVTVAVHDASSNA